VTYLILACKVCLGFTIVVLTVYAIRHYLFALYRISLRNSQDMMELVGFTTPSVSVLVPMHNEEKVAAHVLQALVDCDYDWNRLEILAVDDRSEDRTGEIIDQFAAKYPIIKAIHRSKGVGGKGAALRIASAQASGEILLLFDADYVPGRSMIKFLIAPFCDPEVGAVMGRLVPDNGGAYLFAGLLELERSAGYQVGQQARFNLNLTPQFGGTVGGVRASVLKAVGGWNAESLGGHRLDLPSAHAGMEGCLRKPCGVLRGSARDLGSAQSPDSTLGNRPYGVLPRPLEGLAEGEIPEHRGENRRPFRARMLPDRASAGPWMVGLAGALLHSASPFNRSLPGGASLCGLSVVR